MAIKATPPSSILQPAVQISALELCQSLPRRIPRGKVLGMDLIPDVTQHSDGCGIDELCSSEVNDNLCAAILKGCSHLDFDGFAAGKIEISTDCQCRRIIFDAYILHMLSFLPVRMSIMDMLAGLPDVHYGHPLIASSLDVHHGHRPKS